MNSQFLQHLNQEQAAIAAFIELLDQEADVMTQGRFSELSELTERKSRMADTLAILGRQRENEQIRLGYKADRSGAETLVAAGGPALQKAWMKLRECAAQAHERNHRNGVMIHTHLDFTRQSISVLNTGGGSKPLYGPDGTHSRRAGSGKSLISG
jgi:flagella synthesis protein FlgN